MTTWTKEWDTQSDKWHLTVNLGDILCDNLWRTILFHTGVFYNEDTQWQKES